MMMNVQIHKKSELRIRKNRKKNQKTKTENKIRKKNRKKQKQIQKFKGLWVHCRCDEDTL